MPVDATKGLEEHHWKHLLDSLEEERCIICIGPQVYTTNIPQEKALASFLQEKAEQMRIRVYEDGWFHYLPDASEIDAWQRIKEFYLAPLPAKVNKNLQLIGQIPFHFLLNFTPSYHLQTAFEEQDFVYNFLSYQKKLPFDESHEANQHTPTKLKPLIYNMLGEVKRRNSLVMTYNDFYTYMESVFESGSMSATLRENIWEADYFIFLGMPFEKWYVHLFMRILQQHERNKSSKKYAANVFLDSEVTTHSAEQYTMTFVPNGIENFLSTFLAKVQERGIQRSSLQSQKFDIPFEQLELFLRKDKIESIFDHLITQLNDIGTIGQKWKNEFIQMEGRHNDLKRNIRMGVLDERDRIVEMNRIRANIVSALKEMKKEFS